jgi:hypothetical protein
MFLTDEGSWSTAGCVGVVQTPPGDPVIGWSRPSAVEPTEVVEFNGRTGQPR